MQAALLIAAMTSCWLCSDADASARLQACNACTKLKLSYWTKELGASSCSVWHTPLQTCSAACCAQAAYRCEHVTSQARALVPSALNVHSGWARKHHGMLSGMQLWRMRHHGVPCQQLCSCGSSAPITGSVESAVPRAAQTTACI